MTTHRDRWLAIQKRVAESKPWLRLDRVRIEELKDGKGWVVIIEGVNLRSAVSPPAITVGSKPLEQVRFAPDGRSIRGIVPYRPSDLRVVVDYGFARAELYG